MPRSRRDTHRFGTPESMCLTDGTCFSCRPSGSISSSCGCSMNRAEFERLRGQYDVVPFVREMSADALTPVAAFAALSPQGAEAFLFESVERGENVGRYSFVGFEPRRNLTFDRSVADPVAVLNQELVPLRVYREESLPPFFGGAVGYFGYGVSGWTERLPDSKER